MVGVFLMMKMYTDGACLKNPGGAGGWAFAGDGGLTGAGGEAETTNNRREMRAVIEALRATPGGHTVILYSDSQYVVKGASSWLVAWKRKGWRTRDGSPVKNDDLWREIDRLQSERTVRFQWVRGHNGNPMNELCDRMANAAAHRAAVVPSR